MQESQEDSQLSELNGSLGNGRQKLQLSDLKSERSNSPSYKSLLMHLPTYRFSEANLGGATMLNEIDEECKAADDSVNVSNSSQPADLK